MFMGICLVPGRSFDWMLLRKITQAARIFQEAVEFTTSLYIYPVETKKGVGKSLAYSGRTGASTSAMFDRRRAVG